MQTPEEMKGKTYKVSKGAIDSGKPYEIKLTALLSLKCCLEDLEHFWIASNVKQCGNLDDVILFKKRKNSEGVTYLIQLKHEDEPVWITKAEILGPEGKFSLATYSKGSQKLLNAISNNNNNNNDDRTIKKFGIADHLRKNSKRIYILFTNKDVAGEFEFLEHVEACPHSININGNVYRFKEDEVLKVCSRPVDGDFITKFFFYVKQPHIREVDNQIKLIFKQLLDNISIPNNELNDIVGKFLYFVEYWFRGWLNGHYPLTKTLILKKITEIMLEPFMVRLSAQSEILETDEEEAKYVVWNEMITSKNLIFINGSDHIIDEFIKKFIYRFIVKHKWSMKDYKVKKDFMRVTEAPQAISFCQVYEYLWKTHQIPLVIQVCSRGEIDRVTEILRVSQGVFRIIILNRSKIVINYVRSPRTIFTASDLKEQQRRKLANLPIKLQGRYLSGIQKLNFDEERIMNLDVRDIIYILCNRVNIGGELEVLPDGFVKRILKRVWIKPNVLSEVTNDLFVLQCKSLEDFQDLIQRNNLHLDDSQIIKWQNDFDFHNHRIILCENLKMIEDYFRGNVERSIHFLILNQLKLEWVKSLGSVQDIKLFRIYKMCEEDRIINNESIRNFFQQENRLIVISSNSGMGKSVLINYFARNIPTDFWVIKINLATYQTSYKNFANESECDSILKVFFKQTLEAGCKENLFLTQATFMKFYESKKIAVLLDGFDEISTEYRNDAKRFLKVLSLSGYFVLVTTKPVLKNDLESLLDTFSLDLKLFTTEEQEEFLENCFSKLYENEIEREAAISAMKKLLHATKHDLNDDSNEFTGVPLQMFLLIEEFQDCLENGLQINDFMNFSRLSLYRKLISKKIQIARAKTQQYKPCRAFYALRLLFSEEDLKELQIDLKLQIVKSVFPNMLESVQEDGIIVGDRFIHPIFAEYLAGEWLAENIRNENDDIAKKLYRITFESNLKFARNIFDRILAKGHKLHLAIIDFEMDEVVRLISSTDTNDVDDGNRSFLHLLASWGLQHPSKCDDCELSEFKSVSNDDKMMEILMLIPQEQLRNSKDHILEYTPIDYAIISRSLHIADVLCQKIANSRICINIENLDSNFLLTYCYKMNYLALHCLITN